MRAKISPLAWDLIRKVTTLEIDRLKLSKLNLQDHNFVHGDCIPADALLESQIRTDPKERWKIYPLYLDHLKTKARSLGLWDLFFHKLYTEGVGLSNLEYAIVAEITGRGKLAPEVGTKMIQLGLTILR